MHDYTKKHETGNFKSASGGLTGQSTGNKSAFYLQDNRQQLIVQKKQFTRAEDESGENSFKGPDNSIDKQKASDKPLQMKRIRGGKRKRAKVRAQREREKIKADAAELKKVRKIAAEVPIKEDMDCDRWAREFQELLDDADLPFTPKVILVRPDKDLNKMAPGAEIHYAGNKIGHDSHFFTTVEIGGQRYSFDNVNPRGVEEREHRMLTKIFIDAGTVYDPALEEKDKKKDLITESIRADKFHNKSAPFVIKNERKLRAAAAAKIKAEKNKKK